MAVTYRTLGTLQPITYFENYTTGEIALPPTDETAYHIKPEMARRGFEYKEATTLREIDKLQHKIQDWEYKVGQQAQEHDEQLAIKVRSSVRQRLMSRMVSGSTHPWERDFIKNYLMLREEKRDKWQKEFNLHRDCYFSLRENDNLNHIKDSVESVPEMKDDTCVKCGQFRRMKDSKLCFTCAGG
jgi:hypothetical protein